MATMYDKIKDAAKKGKVLGPPRSDTTPAGLQVSGGDGSQLERKVDLLRQQIGPDVKTVANPDADPSNPASAAAQEQARADEERRRKIGRQSTLLTGDEGLLSTPYIARRSLLGR